MTTEVEEKIKKMADFRTLLVTSVITAMGFVVGLFWNDALKETIVQIVPQGDALYYKYIGAVIVTVVVAVASYLLYRSQRINMDNLQKAVEANKSRQLGALRKLGLS